MKLIYDAWNYDPGFVLLLWSSTSPLHFSNGHMEFLETVFHPEKYSLIAFKDACCL